MRHSKYMLESSSWTTTLRRFWPWRPPEDPPPRAPQQPRPPRAPLALGVVMNSRGPPEAEAEDTAEVELQVLSVNEQEQEMFNDLRGKFGTMNLAVTFLIYIAKKEILIGCTRDSLKLASLSHPKSCCCLTSAAPRGCSNAAASPVAFSAAASAP